AEVNFGGGHRNLIVSIDRQSVDESLMERCRPQNAGEHTHLTGCQIDLRNLRRWSSDCAVGGSNHGHVSNGVVRYLGVAGKCRVLEINLRAEGIARHIGTKHEPLSASYIVIS